MPDGVSMKNDLSTNQLLLHYQSLLQQIDSINTSSLYELCTGIEESAELTDGEKRLHCELTQEIVNLADKFQQMNWMSEHLKILHELGQTFTRTFREEEIYQKAFELLSRVMRADAFFISFYNEGESEIQVPFSVEAGIRYQIDPIPFGRGYISQVISSKQTIHLKKHEDDPQSESLTWGNQEQDTNTCIFVPMLLGDQIRGVISAQSYESFAYRDEHEELLKIIGFQVASAVETARLYDKLYQVSIKDELTGLKNYRAFHQDLEKMLAEASEMDRVTLIMLDSDNLKKVNDKYGHHMGDLLIQRIAEALKSCKEPQEDVYRYAGDEFMILSPKTIVETAEKRVLAIMRFLQENPLIHQGEAIPVTVSAGIASFPCHADNADELKRAADAALYDSKYKGKDCISIFNGV